MTDLGHTFRKLLLGAPIQRSGPWADGELARVENDPALVRLLDRLNDLERARADDLRAVERLRGEAYDLARLTSDARRDLARLRERVEGRLARLEAETATEVDWIVERCRTLVRPAPGEVLDQTEVALLSERCRLLTEGIAAAGRELAVWDEWAERLERLDDLGRQLESGLGDRVASPSRPPVEPAPADERPADRRLIDVIESERRAGRERIRDLYALAASIEDRLAGSGER